MRYAYVRFSAVCCINFLMRFPNEIVRVLLCDFRMIFSFEILLDCAAQMSCDIFLVDFALFEPLRRHPFWLVKIDQGSSFCFLSCALTYVLVGRLVGWENEFKFCGGGWCKCEVVGDRRVCVEVV
jgi:hypothetical protein